MRRTLLLLSFFHPLLTEPPGKRKEGEKKQETPQRAGKRPWLQKLDGTTRQERKLKPFLKYKNGSAVLLFLTFCSCSDQMLKSIQT